jgi:hypothetical protein
MTHFIFHATGVQLSEKSQHFRGFCFVWVEKLCTACPEGASPRLASLLRPAMFANQSPDAVAKWIDTTIKTLKKEKGTTVTYVFAVTPAS